MDNKKDVTFTSILLENKWLYAILFFLLSIILVCCIYFFLYDMNTITDNGITLDEYNRIQSGMSYKDVVSIIGEYGTELGTADLGLGSELVTTIYVWYGSNGIANASITFQGDKVTIKTQLGLN
jgi:hypothetical protein